MQLENARTDFLIIRRILHFVFPPLFLVTAAVAVSLKPLEG